MKKFKNKSEEGKYWRRKGQEHELKVRKELEAEGWIVSKWQNNLDLITKEIIPAKYNRFSRSTGFPDFVAFRKYDEGFYELVLIEAKLKGTEGLDKEEKEKIKILENSFGFVVKVL